MKHLRQLETRSAEPADAAAVLSEIKTAFGEYQESVTDLAERLAKLEDQRELAETRAARPGVGATERGSRQSPDDQKGITEFKNFLKRGTPMETKLTQVAVGSDGGFALPEIIDRFIDNQLLAINPMRQLATVVQVGSPDFKQLVGVRGTGSGWVAENATRSETNTPTMQEVAPTFGMVYCYPRATEESLNDILFDVETWLQTNVADEMALQEATAFTTGNGTARPTGFLAGPTPVTTTDATRAFGMLQYIPGGQAAALPTSIDTLIGMQYRLSSPYRANAVWQMNSNTASLLRQYKDTTNQYLWQPATQQGQPEMFLGYPLILNEQMPDVAANAFPIAFGDFRRGYLIADLVGTRITRDEVTQPGFVKFYIRRRVGGKLRDTNAIKLLRISTT